MTLVEITFELQSPLTAKQLSALAEFANTYGLRRFRHDEAHNLITFEYDASRLRQSQVVHALGHRPGEAVDRRPGAERCPRPAGSSNVSWNVTGNDTDELNLSRPFIR